MGSDCKILSDLLDNTGDHLPMRLQIGVTNSSIKRAQARSRSFSGIDWNKPDVCDMYTRLIRHQPLSPNCVHGKCKEQRRGSVCCEHCVKNVYTSSVKPCSLVKNSKDISGTQDHRLINLWSFRRDFPRM